MSLIRIQIYSYLLFPNFYSIWSWIKFYTNETNNHDVHNSQGLSELHPLQFAYKQYMIHLLSRPDTLSFLLWSWWNLFPNYNIWVSSCSWFVSCSFLPFCKPYGIRSFCRLMKQFFRIFLRILIHPLLAEIRVSS